MFLRRRPHSGHKIAWYRARVREAKIAQQCQEVSHDQVDHGESYARCNSRYEGNAFQEVELSITKGENSLRERVPSHQPLLVVKIGPSARLTRKPFVLFFSASSSSSVSGLIGM